MNNSSPRSSLVRRPIFITGLVAALAAGIGTGCSSTGSKYGWNTSGRSYQNNEMAAMSSVRVDPETTRGAYDSQWFQQRASEVRLPAVWVSEAAQAVHEMESRRAMLEAQRINGAADRSEKLAYADAQRDHAMVEQAMRFADAQFLRDRFDAELSELDAYAMSQEKSIEDGARYNDSVIRATTQERQARFDTLRSSATSEFEQAAAQHERMLAERVAVEDSGWASISEMTRIADMTESRASSKVKALRTSGQTLQSQTSARVEELSQRMSSLRERVSTEVASLREQAGALKSQSFADADELVARAVEIETSDHEALYELTVKNAEQSFNKAKAEAVSHQAHADSMLTEVEAELTRRRSDAARFLGVAEADFNKNMQEIDTAHAGAIAEVEMLEKFAVTLELEAQGQYIAAEAAAVAGVELERATHQDDLAQKQFEAARAEAAAAATNLRAQIQQQIAQQLASGSVSLPEFVDPQNPMSSFDEYDPMLVNPSDAPAPFEPEHVAQFKTTLARAALVSAKARALETAADATFEQSRKNLAAWWTQKQAMHDRFLAEADAMEQKAVAKAEQMSAEAESMEDVGRAQHDRAMAEAEAIRKDALAQATALRAKAKSIKEKSMAGSTQLLAEANAREESGEAEIKSLKVQVESERTRGEARARECFAEADAVEQGQAAVVAQMRQEIRTAEQVLRAELVRLDQSADSFLQIAQATYEEAKAVANSYDAKTKIMATKMQADSEADYRYAMAGVEHLRNVNSAQELAAQAHVDRALAQAEFDRSGAEFTDSMRRAELEKQSRIASAQIESEKVKAGAMDVASVALFEARIAGVTADRDRAYAQAYLSEQSTIARRNQAIAAAAAYREISNAAVARMNSTRHEFEVAASENWDSRLAIPGALTQQDLDGSKWLLQNASFDVDVAGVPDFQD
ncbi:MAG: hypothetical protein H6813_02170 [Phycisphaeraceae bacterium]|nr:hypothetical protein [Phycisphaeraceae bacterium]